MIPIHRVTEDLSDLTRELMLVMPGIGEGLAIHYLQRAIIKFCEVSSFWHEGIEITKRDGVATYDLSLGAYLQIVDVKRVEVDGIEVRQNVKDMGSLARWVQRSPDTIELYLDTGDVATITVAVKPKLHKGVFKVSELILTDYRDALIKGAKAELYAIPKRDWTDLNASQLNAMAFESAASAAANRQASGFSRIPRRPPPRGYRFF